MAKKKKGRVVRDTLTNKEVKQIRSTAKKKSNQGKKHFGQDNPRRHV